jgi:acetyl esterase/lipase
MNQKGQLMGVPIKLVMAIVIGVMAMGILMQFVGTAERMVLRDMDVRLSNPEGNKLRVRIYDAASGDALGGATVVVKYPGGMKAHTLGTSSNQYTFSIPLEGADVVVATVRVTRNGYIPWEGEVAVG